MSTYVREKVLRVPTDVLFEGSEWLNDEEYKDEGVWYIAEKFPELFKHATVGYFQSAPTEENFVDYVLEYEWDSFGEYGKVRELYDTEMERFLPIYRKLNPKFLMKDMKKVRLVEFCWYNGTEAKGYYEMGTDTFYDEVLIPGKEDE